MAQKLKIVGAAAAILLSIGWIVVSARSKQLGSQGNNGVTSEFPAPPPEARKAMEKMMKDGPPKMPEGDPSDPEVQKKMREQFEKDRTPEEKEQMRKFGAQMQERMQRVQKALTPEDQRMMMQKMMKQFRGGRPPFGPPPGNGPRPPAP